MNVGFWDRRGLPEAPAGDGFGHMRSRNGTSISRSAFAMT